MAARPLRAPARYAGPRFSESVSVNNRTKCGIDFEAGIHYRYQPLRLLKALQITKLPCRYEARKPIDEPLEHALGTKLLGVTICMSIRGLYAPVRHF